MSQHSGFYSDGTYLYYNDVLYSGLHDNVFYKNGLASNGVLDGLHYGNDGLILNNVVYNNRYYVNGKLGSGYYNGILYRDGIKYTGLASNAIVTNWNNLHSTDIGSEEKYYRKGVVGAGTVAGKRYGSNGTVLNDVVINGVYFKDGSFGSGLKEGKLFKAGRSFSGVTLQNEITAWPNFNNTTISNQITYYSSGAPTSGIYAGTVFLSSGLVDLSESLTAGRYLYRGKPGTGLYDDGSGYKLYKDGYLYTGGISPSKISRSSGYNGVNISSNTIFISGLTVSGDMLFYSTSALWDNISAWTLTNGDPAISLPNSTTRAVVLGRVAGSEFSVDKIKSLSVYENSVLGPLNGTLNVTEGVIFYDNSINQTTIQGGASFYDYSQNAGTVDYGYFYDHSTNAPIGSVSLGSIFDGDSESYGRLMGTDIVKNNASIKGFVFYPSLTQTDYAYSSTLYFKAHEANNNWYDTRKWFLDQNLSVPALGLPYSATNCFLLGNGNTFINADDGRWVDPVGIYSANSHITIKSVSDHTLFTSITGNVDLYNLSLSGSVYGTYLGLWDSAAVNYSTATPIISSSLSEEHDLFFKLNSDLDWYNVNNWYLNRDLTQSSPRLPNDGSFCYLISSEGSYYNMSIDIDNNNWISPLYIDAYALMSLTFSSQKNSILTSTITLNPSSNVTLSGVLYY